MVDSLPNGRSVAAAVTVRQSEIGRALAELDDQQLRGPSHLPGWDRLTIACHLRFGARASERMTIDALAGTPTAFYPNGRSRQRETTLRPDEGESPTDVVTSLSEISDRLDRLWANLDNHEWDAEIREPADNKDLGTITLGNLALLRLTEVEVHGHDLDLNLSPWSATFVEAALPTRLTWLSTRRSNHQSADHSIDGSWALAATDGPTFRINAHGAHVEVDAVSATPQVDATIATTSTELLAFILGRAPLDALQVRGDHTHAASFLKAVPAP
jgi:uncharacterized protein (TIGR03083 family)